MFNMGSSCNNGLGFSFGFPIVLCILRLIDSTLCSTGVTKMYGGSTMVRHIKINNCSGTQVAEEGK